MKITLAQINTKVGDLKYNESKILNVVQKYGENSDLIVFPEMTTTGYPINDMIENDDFVIEQKKTLKKVQDVVVGFKHELRVILGYVEYDKTKFLPNGNMMKRNAASVISKNQILAYQKRLLPDYDVFFEGRYFVPGKENLIFDIGNNQKGMLTICEDIWDKYYESHPISEVVDSKEKIDFVFNISSSPFGIDKLKKRFELLQQHNQKLPANYIYVNQVGGQDELVFDGNSMFLDKEGKLTDLLNGFEEHIKTIDTAQIKQNLAQTLLNKNNDKYKNIFESLKLGIKDYMDKTGIKKIVIGISGGIDSAVSACLLKEILPSDQIFAMYLPTKYNSNESMEYSKTLANNLGINLEIFPIENILKIYEESADMYLGKKLDGISHENIQARIRGNILMQKANMIGGAVINNSNQTELAMGYGTLYGDLIGFLSPLGDLNKKEVYELADYINNIRGNIIPKSIIGRQASAELKPNQVDPFDYAKRSDAIEEILNGKTTSQIAQKYNIDDETIQKLEKMKKTNEFKRRVSPLVIKLKKRSIGIGRKYPVVS